MRADKLVNPIESLTPPEKERLGFLIMWALDGPEQGFINALDTFKCQLELQEFMGKNGIHCGGQWSIYAKWKIKELSANPKL